MTMPTSDDHAAQIAFSEDATQWVRDGYTPDDAHVYPTPLHRMRLLCNWVDQGEREQSIIDLGCGGGHLSIALGRMGHKVTAYDRSPEMLEICHAELETRFSDHGGRVIFRQADISKDMDLDGSVHDKLISMGVIGYLDTDDLLFELGRRALRPGGQLIVSCRNRLFNMVSLSHRTRRETETGDALELLDEIESYYQQVSRDDTNNLLKVLIRSAEAALELPKAEVRDEPVQVEKGPEVLTIEPRQQTPKGMQGVAERHGFKQLATFGIHPHLLDPRLNRLLPEGIYNQLTAAAEQFEALPIAMVWSSVFIGVYELQA